MSEYTPKQWKINNMVTKTKLKKLRDYLDSDGFFNYVSNIVSELVPSNDKYFNVYCSETSASPYIAFGSANSNISSGQELAVMCEDGEFISGTLFYQYGTAMIAYTLVKYFYDEDLEHVTMRYATNDKSLDTHNRIVEMNISADTLSGFDVNEVFFNG